MLAARHEHAAALLASPDITHLARLRVKVLYEPGRYGLCAARRAGQYQRSAVSVLYSTIVPLAELGAGGPSGLTNFGISTELAE
jgi:hypothetical protein